MSRFGFKIDGDTLENNYKEHLSGFREWDQLAHADNWVLLVENMGEHMNIDECMHARDLFTFVSNKDGHGKKGTLAAAVRGTKASVAVEVLMRIPEEKRLAVKEMTMDYSDSMYSIVRQAFPNATIVIDCFHVMKNQCDALDSIRMKFKRKAISGQNREKREFNPRRETGNWQGPDTARHIPKDGGVETRKTKKTCQREIRADGIVQW